MAAEALVQVGDLGREIGQDTVPVVEALRGRKLELSLEDGAAVRVELVNTRELRWEVLSGSEQGSGDTERYFAFAPRDDIYFIDCLLHARRATSVSAAVDLVTGSVTAVVATLPTKTEAYETGLYGLANEGRDLPLVRTRFVRAAVDRPFVHERHAHVPTLELVGKRIRYAYNNGQTYEHIYLNHRIYAYQCLEGVEKDSGDVDLCYYYRVDDQLYFFVWREKIVPTLGVLLIDLRQMRTCGKLFGYESDSFVELTNVPVAAQATLLNVTEHD